MYPLLLYVPEAPGAGVLHAVDHTGSFKSAPNVKYCLQGRVLHLVRAGSAALPPADNCL